MASEKTRKLLEKHRDELKAEIDAIEAKSGPLRDKPIEDQMRELADQIKALEQPHLYDLKMDYAEVCRSLGARSLKAESIAPPDDGQDK
jgi:hypothetical protein